VSCGVGEFIFALSLWKC